MNLKITSVADKGIPQKERLVLKAELDTDIGLFAVFRAFVQADSVTNYVTDAYWFPNKDVKAGDLIVLYSKIGKDSERLNKNGTTVHFFYWSRDDDVKWADEDFVPVLAYTPEWEPFLPSVEGRKVG